MKIQKKNCGGGVRSGGGGLRVDVYKELKFLLYPPQKKMGGSGRELGRVGGQDSRVDVNREVKFS